MATDSGGEEQAATAAVGKLMGSEKLTVEDDLREMAKKAAWSVSSGKAGNGVLSLRDDNLETYWQFSRSPPSLPLSKIRSSSSRELGIGEMRPVFCGNFEYETRHGDLERLFSKYGRVDRVDMKSGIPDSLSFES